MREDVWEDWYAKRAGAIEPEVPTLATRIRDLGFNRVLDAGCGAGRHVGYLAREGFHVYGIDRLESAVLKTKALLAAERLEANVQLLDLRNPLPFPDDHFGFVLSTRAVHHMPCQEVDRAIRELVRVLAPRGYMFLQIPMLEDDVDFLRRGGSPEWRVHFIDEHTVLPETGEEAGVPHHYFTQSELTQLFRGLVIEEHHSATEHYRGHCLILRKST